MKIKKITSTQRRRENAAGVDPWILGGVDDESVCSSIIQSGLRHPALPNLERPTVEESTVCIPCRLRRGLWRSP